LSGPTQDPLIAKDAMNGAQAEGTEMDFWNG